jgi:beta-lactamase superfamily II metal-dependent hydrolase
MTAVQFPQVYYWGSTTAHILHPDPDLVEPDQNQSSLVVLLIHERFKFLFTGDIDLNAEATVIARGTPLAAEFLYPPPPQLLHQPANEFGVRY